MRWHTAHKNSRRVRGASRPGPKNRKNWARLGWEQWLEQVLPSFLKQNLLHEQSLFARIMEGAKNYRTRNHSISFPRRPEDFTVTAEGVAPSRSFIIVDDIDFP